MSNLARIIELRERRRDSMKRVEKTARGICDDARNQLHAARNAMERYAEEVRTLEIDLLRDLMNTELRKNDFDRFREKLDAAAKKAQQLAAQYHAAGFAVEKAERAVDRAHRDTRRIESKLNRISQVERVQREDADLLSVRALDAESDDIAEMMYGRGRGV
jgi:predicted RNase H-like nuclease (RuvC/YqgF family)